MNRKCKSWFKSKDGKKAIYVDSINKDEIKDYILQDKRHRKKFYHIVEGIFNNFKMTSLYDKEDYNTKAKDITAMKFFKGQENDRIYCKEINSEEGVLIIVTSVLMKKKKSDKLTSKEKNIIDTIAKYNYTYED